ncbi:MULTISPECIES: hypothetical protein [unclassified Pseudomonas]|uniref:hypothetical protein n=1 Tax=unclassified Pseudomonas TaxID=196821 RepID=UPI0015B51178|nr:MULTISPECIES: hypothetical protein [unclassified Pseudomonas]
MMTLDILELRIEEKFRLQAKRDRNAPNGHSVNIDAKSVTFFIRNDRKTYCGSGLAREDGVSVNGHVD